MRIDGEEGCDINGSLEELSHAVAVAQHHDAVTGTEKQYVAEDYHYHLDKSSQNFLYCAFEKSVEGVGRYNCPLRNISQCSATEGEEMFYVSVYNPLPRISSSLIKFPITTNDANISIMVGYLKNIYNSCIVLSVFRINLPYYLLKFN